MEPKQANPNKGMPVYQRRKQSKKTPTKHTKKGGR